jgi:hypothetical protein
VKKQALRGTPEAAMDWYYIGSFDKQGSITRIGHEVSYIQGSFGHGSFIHGVLKSLTSILQIVHRVLTSLLQVS